MFPTNSSCARFSLPAQRSLHSLDQLALPLGGWSALSSQLFQKLQPITISAGSPAKWHLLYQPVQPIFPILFLQNRIGVSGILQVAAIRFDPQDNHQ